MPDEKLRYYDIIGVEKYSCEEVIPQIDWELIDRVKIILDHECQMATGTFHGRKWCVVHF